MCDEPFGNALTLSAHLFGILLVRKLQDLSAHGFPPPLPAGERG